MSESSWVTTLAAARQRPALYQGWPPDAHLQAGIREPLRLVWDKHAFEDARRATVDVSPRQYHCRCYTGPLVRGIEQLIQWEQQDILLQGIHQVQRELERETLDWARAYCEPTFYFGGFASLLRLAQRGALGLRTSAGVWCQTYERGWPKTPPTLLERPGSSIGLMVAAALDPRWCPGLPFTPEGVEGVIPESARPHVALEWHREDDIVPECAVDPHCVLHAENIDRWL